MVPAGLLHGNKPCHDDAKPRRHVEERGTIMIPTTLGRPENKAILEGAFGLWEQRVGTTRLDDPATDRLVSSAVAECIRCHTADTNSVPRSDLDGRSRLDVLRETCPREEQQRSDRECLRRLKAAHDPLRRDECRGDLLERKAEFMRKLVKAPCMVLLLSEDYLKLDPARWECAWELADAVRRLASCERSAERTLVVVKRSDAFDFSLSGSDQLVRTLLAEHAAHFKALRDGLPVGRTQLDEELSDLMNHFVEADRACHEYLTARGSQGAAIVLDAGADEATRSQVFADIVARAASALGKSVSS